MSSQRETIITVKPRTGFTVLPNRTLRDNRLSLKTRAILAIMFSLPEDWDYTAAGLSAICGAGRDAVRSALRELEEYGYLTRVQRHDASGHFSRNEYIVTDEPAAEADAPMTDFPATAEPSAGEPSPDEPMTENPTQQNKDCTNTPYSPPQGDVDWALFEQFWSAYPRKQDKERARRSWKKLRPDMALCQVMSDALERDKRSEQWRKNNGEFIPYPSSWLNGRRWEDEGPPGTEDRSSPLRGEGVRYL